MKNLIKTKKTIQYTLHVHTELDFFSPKLDSFSKLRKFFRKFPIFGNFSYI